MTRAPIKNLSILVLLLSSLAFMLVPASPARADHDQSEGNGHDGSATTTTTITTSSFATPTTTPALVTTTTLAPVTTTTVPPTTTTVPARAATTTTSTTRPETTTTMDPPPGDDQWEEQRLEAVHGSTTTTTTGPSEPQDDFDSNQTLVLSIAPSGPGSPDESPSGSDGNGFHVSPREGLTVAFRTAVEVIEGQLLQSMLLGILVAAFFMAGVDKRRAEPKVEAAPLRRSYSTGRQTPGPRTTPRR